MSKTKRAERIEKLKKRANKLYAEMTRSVMDSEEAHTRFHKYSIEYAKVLKEIEQELKL